MNSPRADAIVVLGGGISPEGEASSVTSLRAARSIDLFRSGAAPHLVMSGAYGMFDPNPAPATEARVMAAQALAAGVPVAALHLEEESRDSIGNAVCVKRQLLLLRGWRSIILVTSAWHAQRAGYLWSVVLGPGYDIVVDAVDHPITHRPAGDVALWEAGLLTLSQRWFDGVTPGDDRAIAAVLNRVHPIYAETPELTLADLAAVIEESRQPA